MIYDAFIILTIFGAMVSVFRIILFDCTFIDIFLIFIVGIYANTNKIILATRA